MHLRAADHLAGLDVRVKVEVRAPGSGMAVNRPEQLYQADSEYEVECCDRLNGLPLLRSDQLVKITLHTVRKLLREYSLDLSSAQRAGHGPADPAAISAIIEPRSPGVI